MKNKLMIFLKLSNLSSKLYLVGFLIYFISIGIIASLETPADTLPSFITANFIIVISGSFFILGNLLSYLKKDKDDKSRNLNLAFIVGIIISMIQRFMETY